MNSKQQDAPSAKYLIGRSRTIQYWDGQSWVQLVQDTERQGYIWIAAIIRSTKSRAPTLDEIIRQEKHNLELENQVNRLREGLEKLLKDWRDEVEKYDEFDGESLALSSCSSQIRKLLEGEQAREADRLRAEIAQLAEELRSTPWHYRTPDEIAKRLEEL